MYLFRYKLVTQVADEQYCTQSFLPFCFQTYLYNQYCDSVDFKCPRKTFNKFANHMTEDIIVKWTVQNMAR
jgi:hypothetical protein